MILVSEDIDIMEGRFNFSYAGFRECRGGKKINKYIYRKKPTTLFIAIGKHVPEMLLYRPCQLSHSTVTVFTMDSAVFCSPYEASKNKMKHSQAIDFGF